MLAEQRRDAILSAVRSGQAVTTSDLAERFAVSEMTIRRDFEELAALGLVRRVRGGALQPGHHRFEPPFDESSSARRAEKERIGIAAAEMVQPGDTVLLDIGTTALQLARQLHGRPGLTIVTNNLAVYDELVGDEAVDLVLLGGLVRRHYRSLVGFLTEEALAGIRADLAFIGISGIGDDLTLLDSTVEEIPAKRAMLRAAKHCVLLADAIKFRGGGLGRVAAIDAVDTLITTADADPQIVAAIRELGVGVVIA